MCSSVTFEIVNDVASNEVTFRFSSDTHPEGVECVYHDAFDDTAFVFGMLPDPNGAAKDNFYIHSITVTS